MRISALLVVLLALSSPAAAQSLQVKGKFGFIGEYEILATVSATTSSGFREFTGPMIVKHVGLCTHDGPDEKQGQLRLQKLSSSRIKATLLLDGQKCIFDGQLSEAKTGVMTCPSEPGVPIGLWLE
jgi:hypothetical protein